MSTPWDAHLSKLTAALPNGKCAIFGRDGAQWTSAYSFDPAQMKVLFSGFDDPQALRKEGPTIDGVKYLITQTSDDLIAGKKGTRGVMAVRTRQTYVVCSFDDSQHTPNVVMGALASFADYLLRMNF